jgi:hypothetical protein
MGMLVQSDWTSVARRIGAAPKRRDHRKAGIHRDDARPKRGILDGRAEQQASRAAHIDQGSDTRDHVGMRPQRRPQQLPVPKMSYPVCRHVGWDAMMIGGDAVDLGGK